MKVAYALDDNDNDDIYGEDYTKEAGDQKFDPLEEIQFLAKEINGDINWFKFDPILQRLASYRIILEEKDFRLAGATNEPYKYSMHNAGVLKAISKNMHLRSGISSSKIEKARIIMAVKALAVDLMS